MTQNQLTELLESEGAKAMLETGEERGWIEPAELEAFALEHELVDADVEDLTRELERIGLEVREARPEEKAPKAPEVRPATWVVVTPLSWVAVKAPSAVAPMAEKLVAESAPI